MEYKIQTEHFQGPLDLLLSLVEKRKLFVNDISLSQVSDDFIAYIEKLNDFPIAEIADFLIIASTLVLIKSKSLLPTLELSDDEEGDIEDLEKRLKLYKRFKELAVGIQTEFGSHMLFPRNVVPLEDILFSPHDKITTENIKDAAQRVLDHLPKKEKLTETKVEKVVSIEETVDNLSKRIADNLSMTFNDFANTGERVDVIVGFLALLELVKQGSIRAHQGERFSDIMMESNDMNTPNYI